MQLSTIAGKHANMMPQLCVMKQKIVSKVTGRDLQYLSITTNSVKPGRTPPNPVAIVSPRRQNTAKHGIG